VFEEQSKSWQKTLGDLEQKVKEDGREMLAEDLRAYTDRTIGDAGSEFRFDADFIKARLTQSLNNLKDAVVGKKTAFERVPPAIGKVSPPAVVLKWNDHDHFLGNEALTTIEADGYDIHSLDSGLRLTVKNDKTGDRDVSTSLSITTPYQLQISLGAGGIQFREGDKQLILDWNNNAARYEIPVT
jgi:hypothetical protein